MPERPGDWFADEEGNLSAPDDQGKPPTDEFGRDDPAAIERERRRRERQAQRGGARKAGSGGAGGGGLGGLLGRGRRKSRRTDDLEAEQPPAQPEPTEERRPPRQPRRRPPAPEAAAARPSLGERAAAGREGIRSRLSRGGGGERGPGAPKPPRPPGNYGRRRIAAIAIGLVGILLIWFLVALFQPFAGDGQGDGTVSVEIPEGADAVEVAKILDEKGVVSSARLFQWRLKLAGKEDDVQADTYTLASGMSYGAAISRLTGEESSGVITVTIPEGLSRDQIAADVLPEGVDSAQYLAQTEAPPKGFDPAQYGAKSTNLEGFLFPATYELQPGQGVDVLIKQQLDAFTQNIAGVDMSYAQKKNLTIYDVLIIASMVDKEVQVPKERPLVAAVIYNRLAAGQPLGIDATTRYEYQNYADQITQEQLSANTPYNTRLNAGLPPTPIGNPGLDAIEAAASPAKVPFLYFVVKPGTCGEHSFTADEAEFEQLAAEYQQALEAAGGSPTECPE